MIIDHPLPDCLLLPISKASRDATIRTTRGRAERP